MFFIHKKKKRKEKRKRKKKKKENNAQNKEIRVSLSDNLIIELQTRQTKQKPTSITIVVVKTNSVTRNVSVLLQHNNKNCRKSLPDSTVQQSRGRYRVENTTILIK